VGESKVGTSKTLLEVTESDGVIVLRFNRPEKLNALNLELWVTLRDTLVEKCSGNAKALVLTGSGRAFSSGDDIGAMLNLKDVDEALSFFNTIKSAFEAIIKCPKPIVAAVNGLAVGGGAEILLLVDYVIASRGSWISFPEARLGLIPPILLTLGVDVLGLRLARRLALTGERVSVEEALRMGLVDEVVEEGELMDVALRRALELSDKTTVEALRALREILYARYKAAVDEALRLLALLTQTGSAKELMRAFLEKRFKP
jgi:enoyl-CoA hydratase/carnithine racemase